MQFEKQMKANAEGSQKTGLCFQSEKGEHLKKEII
jgi:hypothetical protein